jgi:hypothetical protein
MVIAHACVGALLSIETDVKALRKRVHRFEHAARPWRDKLVTTVEA